MLLSRAVNATKTDTTELTEPTSIEFDNDFKSLLSEAYKANQDGRVIVLLDNLDRVDSDTAKSIWSTLQTFIRERDEKECPWYKRLRQIFIGRQRGEGIGTTRSCSITTLTI